MLGIRINKSKSPLSSLQDFVQILRYVRKIESNIYRFRNADDADNCPSLLRCRSHIFFKFIRVRIEDSFEAGLSPSPAQDPSSIPMCRPCIRFSKTTPRGYDSMYCKQTNGASMDQTSEDLHHRLKSFNPNAYCFNRCGAAEAHTSLTSEFRVPHS